MAPRLYLLHSAGKRFLQMSMHRLGWQHAGNVAACKVQVMLAYGSYPEVAGAHTLQQIGQIVAREADR